MINIQQEDGRFFVEKDGQTIAELTYVNAGENVIDVNHTFVSDQLRGQGVGEKLLQRAAEYARAEGKQVIPSCTYAKSKMEKDEQYRDVLAK